jgi:tetratricopeptide (TPR) repeat protein
MIRTLLKCSLLLILILVLATGCGEVLPTPEETIQPPKTPGSPAEADEKELYETISNLLPDRAQLVSPANGGSAIQIGDLIRNGSAEVAVVYRIADQSNQLYAVIFTEEDGEWIKLWEETGQGYDLDYLELTDLDGDGTPELLIGWTIGASAGSGLDIYGWTEEGVQLLDQSGYNLIEIGEAGGEKSGKLIALWIKDTGTVFAVDVFRFSEQQLVRAPDLYAQYFPKVVDYYMEQIGSTPDAPILWYYLADAQIKLGQTDEAIRSIAEARKLDPDPIMAHQLQTLEQRATETIDYVLAHMQIGRTQDEILHYFGDQYFEVQPSMEVPGITLAWRYDAVLEPGYFFDNGQGIQIDTVDFDGLKQGKLLYQFFVTWDDNGISRRSSLYYLEDHKVMEYRLFPDGGERLSVILP